MAGAHLDLDVLLVEDNLGDAKLVEHHLDAPQVFEIAGDVTLHHEESLPEGLGACEGGDHDVLFLDLGLPDSSGLETLERVLAEPFEVPIVVLTGLDDRDTAATAIQRGAQDYLLKDDLDADVLARSLRYAVERHEQAMLLERQNERLDEFASVVSHDLRNPLAGAEMRLNVARQECDSAHLDDVADALQRMDGLIDDLLTLARRGETVGELTQVRLPVLAERCWERIDAQDAELDVKTDRLLLADASRLQQLLENLFRNAVQHGGDDVTITVDGLDDGFSVADDGVGIPDDERDGLLDAGASTSESGLRFGLAIVERIAAAHDWEVAVEESAQGGARFEFTGVDEVE